MKVASKLKLRRNGHKDPNAMIVVERTKQRVFRHVPRKHIPKNSFVKDYRGEWMHLLGLDEKGNLWPLVRPEPNEGRMPTDLYMAKHCANEVNEVYGMSMPMSHKIAIGLLVLFGFGILIVLFLIVTAATGGVAA